MLYMLAQRTGLRRRELLTLMPRTFKLDGKLPTVRVEAKNSKHRKEDVLPLPAEIAKELASYLKNKKRPEPHLFGPTSAASVFSVVERQVQVLTGAG